MFAIGFFLKSGIKLKRMSNISISREQGGDAILFLLAPPAFLEIVTRLSRRLYDIKDWLLLTFEAKCTAAISEIGIVRNEVMDAVVATLGLVA